MTINQETPAKRTTRSTFALNSKTKSNPSKPAPKRKPTKSTPSKPARSTQATPNLTKSIPAPKSVSIPKPIATPRIISRIVASQSAPPTASVVNFTQLLNDNLLLDQDLDSFENTPATSRSFSIKNNNKTALFKVALDSSSNRVATSLSSTFDSPKVLSATPKAVESIRKNSSLDSPKSVDSIRKTLKSSIYSPKSVESISKTPKSIRFDNRGILN